MSFSVFNYFLASYSDETVLIKKKAKALLISNLISIIGSIVYLVSLFFTTINYAQIGGFLAAIFFLILSLIVLKLGKLEFAGNITIIIASIVLAVPPFSVSPSSVFQQYNIVFTQLFVFFIAFLFTYRNYQFVIIFFLGLISILAFYFLVTAKLPEPQTGLRANIIIGSLCIYIFSFIATVYINRLFLEIIRNAERSAFENKEKFDRLDSLVSSSKNGMEIGKKLISSTEITVNTINGINNKIKNIKNDMTKLNSEISNSKNANQDILIATTDLKDIIFYQNESIKKTNDSVNEITKMINTITDNSNEKKETIDKLTKTAEDGEKEVNLSIDSMNNLSKNANEILDILSVIENISGQTDLLAMNAAIEAAHAGEAGKGFSIVADEIRKLAENTGANTKIISETLRRNSGDIKAAFSINNRVGEYFNKINKEIKDVSIAIDEIIIFINDLYKKMSEIKDYSNKMEEISNNSESSVSKIENMNKESNTTIISVNNFIGIINEMMDETIKGFDEITNETSRICEIGEINVKYIEDFSDKIKQIKDISITTK